MMLIDLSDLICMYGTQAHRVEGTELNLCHGRGDGVVFLLMSPVAYGTH